ncbi:MAG: hypothetical protein HY293_13640 [Planctomycetes bacterium]|nr:hypothetical protein [Planctomycetota bacterium]
MRDPRRFPFFFLVTVAALAALLGLAWTRHRIREWGHARAVRNLRIQWRLRPAPPVWCPPTNPALLQWGRSWKQSWVVVEDGVEVDSGCSAFYFCG